MLLTFTLPKECLYKAKPCEMVMLPSVEGLFGVMQQHVPTIAELKPGVVSVQEIAGGPLVKYFISGGFAASAPLAVPPSAASLRTRVACGARRARRGGARLRNSSTAPSRHPVPPPTDGRPAAAFTPPACVTSSPPHCLRS